MVKVSAKEDKKVVVDRQGVVAAVDLQVDLKPRASGLSNCLLRAQRWLLTLCQMSSMPMVMFLE